MTARIVSLHPGDSCRQSQLHGSLTAASDSQTRTTSALRLRNDDFNLSILLLYETTL